MVEQDDRYRFSEAAPEPSPVHEASRSLLPALGAALLAGLAGGVVWGLIVKWAGYEVGIVAWGIGFAVGSAVVFATRGAKGPRLQAIAVAGALVGILLGKYLSFAFAVQEDARSVGANIGIVSSEMFRFFRENLDDVFGLFDLLWIGFAVYTAWKLTRSEQREPTTLAPPAP